MNRQLKLGLSGVGVVLAILAYKPIVVGIARGDFLVGWVGAVVGVSIVAALFAGLKTAFTKKEDKNFLGSMAWSAWIITGLAVFGSWSS